MRVNANLSVNLCLCWLCVCVSCLPPPCFELLLTFSSQKFKMNSFYIEESKCYSASRNKLKLNFINIHFKALLFLFLLTKKLFSCTFFRTTLILVYCLYQPVPSRQVFTFPFHASTIRKQLIIATRNKNKEEVFNV